MLGTRDTNSVSVKRITLRHRFGAAGFQIVNRAKRAVC